MENVPQQVSHLHAVCLKANDYSAQLINKPFFQSVNISIKYANAELCFNTLVSHLYVLFNEASGRNLSFVSRKFQPYQILINEDALLLPKVVHAFRTILQHNTDFENSKSDQEKKAFCTVFFYSIIQKREAQEDDEWLKCCLHLLNLSIIYLEAINSCLTKMLLSENRNIIKEEWDNVINRSYSIYEFEKILIKVLKELGLDGIFDTNKICKIEIDKWRKELDVLADNFNFEIEGQRIVEKFVLKKEILPITSKDLIQIGFEVGQELRVALEKAKFIFYQSPCDKDELLIRMKSFLSERQ